MWDLPQSGSGAVAPSTSQLEGTAGDSTVPIESEMKESGSLELLDPSVSAASLKEPERAATLPTELLKAPAVLLEGMLGRKHDVEGSGKKASNRSIKAQKLFFLPLPCASIEVLTIPNILFPPHVFQEDCVFPGKNNKLQEHSVLIIN